MAMWLPLESNPDVLTKYIHKTGVPENWVVVDVLSVDPDELQWIPKPVKAFIMIFPVTEAYEQHCVAEHGRLADLPQKHPDDLFYMRQFTHNACGTIAMIHAIANNKEITLSDGVLKDFLEKTKDLTPTERGKALDEDMGLAQNHQELAQLGQTAVNASELPNHHFVTLVHNDGELYELDGRKEFPIQHGEATEDTFTMNATKICREFMKRDTDDLRFHVMALVPLPV